MKNKRMVIPLPRVHIYEDIGKDATSDRGEPKKEKRRDTTVRFKGQPIGCFDCNGVEIKEGDRVKCTERVPIPTGVDGWGRDIPGIKQEFHYQTDVTYGVVKYLLERGEFRIVAEHRLAEPMYGPDIIEVVND